MPIEEPGAPTPKQPERPRPEDIEAKAKNLFAHLEKSADELGPEIWHEHLASVVYPLIMLAIGEPHNEIDKLEEIYVGYTAEDFETLITRLMELSPDVRKAVEEVQETKD